jgi:hypothetical protein
MKLRNQIMELEKAGKTGCPNLKKNKVDVINDESAGFAKGSNSEKKF